MITGPADPIAGRWLALFGLPVVGDETFKGPAIERRNKNRQAFGQNVEELGEAKTFQPLSRWVEYSNACPRILGSSRGRVARNHNYILLETRIVGMADVN